MLYSETELLTMVADATQECEQQHPNHKQNVGDRYNTVWEHTMLVLDHVCHRYAHKVEIFKELYTAAILHDIGKVAVKSFNEEKGHDTFYKHAKASIEWCDEHDVNITDLTRFLIERHDVMFEKEKTVHKYVRKYSEKWVTTLLKLREADINGQHDSFREANLKQVNQARTWIGSFTS